MRYFNATIVDEAGNIQPNSWVEVRNEATGLLVNLFDINNLPVANPFQVGADAFAQFRTDFNGYFSIRATLPTADVYTWRYVPLFIYIDYENDVVLEGNLNVLLNADIDGNLNVDGDQNIAGDITAGGRINGNGSVIPGTILPYAGTATPAGYLLCNAAAVNRITYAALFAAIGVTWGNGDGLTTFNLPDSRGAFLRGTGSHGSETMADGNPFTGPAVGAYENDQFQAWQLGANQDSTGAREYWGITGNRDFLVQIAATVNHTPPYLKTTDQGSAKMLLAKNDGTHGDIRQDDETRPFNAGVTYIIKT